MSITGCDLVALPEEIRSLRNLQVLNAEINELVTVPRWLEELPLEDLYLEGNNLEEFPFLHLPRLTGLFLGDNHLKRLPCVVRDYPLD